VRNVSDKTKDFWLAAGLSLFAAIAFYFTTKATHQHFDYTFRIAGALLHGNVGLENRPPAWLNEMVPRDGRFYSVFPLGAVLSVVPVALLQKAGWVHSFPAHFLAASIAGLCVFFFFQLSRVESKSIARRILLALFPIFGTWAWCNLGFGGAWQIALGFALLGEVAALHFTLVRPRPFLAGIFFALAVGNRTEVGLTLPLYLYFVWRAAAPDVDRSNATNILNSLRKSWPALIWFLIVPVALGLLTAAYNLARIPKLLQEPWYQHGLFSLHAIPGNIYHMLFKGLGDTVPKFPYILPYAFGCSIFIASPFLFLLFREGGKYKAAAWIAIGLVTAALWCHGNPGGWQFSYRYAMTLLPWMFLLIVGNGPAKVSVIEISLFAVSVAINALATYEFLWTRNVHP
jgi:hypothetical protein